MKKGIIILLIALASTLLLASCDAQDVPSVITDDYATSEAESSEVESTTRAPSGEKIKFELSAVGIEHAISLSWNALDAADKYEIYVNSDGSEDFDLICDSTETSFSYEDLPWGKTYSFYIRATKNGRMIARSNVCEASCAGVRVNDLAERDGLMTVYSQKVGSKKSDGFIVIVNGEIYVVDSGYTGDTQVNDYLMSLRNKWLADSGKSELENDRGAKLAVNFIISHSHSDHVNAIPALLSNTFLSVENMYAPTRAYLGTEGVSGAIGLLVDCEDRIDAIKADLVKYGHGAGKVTHVPFGEHIEIKFEKSDAILDLYPALFDWSETRASALEGWKYVLSNSSNTEQNRTNTILNWNCLWAKFTLRGQSVLFTGDTGDKVNVINKMMEYYGTENFDCDVLKYIHHGQVRYSSYLTQVTSPKITIFSVTAGGEDKNALSSSLAAGDVYLLSKGDLTLIFDGKNIISEGISPE